MFEGRWSKLRNPWVATGVVLATILVIGLGLFVWQVGTYVVALQRGEDLFQKNRLDASVTQLLRQTPITTTDLSHLEAGMNPMIGNPEAKIRIVEFLDYQCPFTKRSAPDIRAFMIRHPNDVVLIVRDFPLESIHGLAIPASLAARCVFAQGDVNRYWNFHDQIFRFQDSLSAQALRTIASNVGADLRAYDSCIADSQTMVPIKSSLNDGLAAGVRGTPTFFINGIRVPGALDLATLETIYERIVATKS